MVTIQEQNRITPGVGAALAAFFFFLGVVAAIQYSLGSHGPIGLGNAPRIEEDDSVEALALLGQRTSVGRSAAFRRADVAVLLGHCELDLREAKLAPGGARVEMLAFLGRVRVRVPEDWTVVRGEELILGSYSNRTRRTQADPDKQLRLEGLILAGALEVTH